MESLALSPGCDRTQLELAVAQSHPEEPAKTALLWAAKTHLGTLSRAGLRARYDELLGNPLVVPAYPRYLSGLVYALEPVPALAGFAVEAVSNAFGRLPDPILLPWLPALLGCDDPWKTAAPAPPGAALLDRYPATTQALEPLPLTPYGSEREAAAG
jgi:hypothetical protein